MTSGAQNQARLSNIESSRPGSRDSKASRTPHIQPSAELSNKSDLQHEGHVLSDEPNDGTSYPQPVDEQLQPPADFRPSITIPYFTLIEDNTTGEHYHPSVHYIFEDDEPDLLLAASVRVLGSKEDYQSPIVDKSDREEYESALLPLPAQ